MLPIDILRLSTRMFRTNRSRTLLTILGISVGIGTILFLVSFGYGLQRIILGQITNSDALLSLDVTTADLEGLKLDQQSLDKIKGTPNVQKIMPLATINSQLKVNGISSEVQTNFAAREFFNLEGTVMKTGRTFDDAETDKFIVTTAALKLFNIAEDQAVGQKARFILLVPKEQSEIEKDPKNIFKSVDLVQEFEIIGVIDDENSSAVYMPISIYSTIGLSDYSKIKVKVNQDKDLEPVRNAIIESGFSVSALSDTIEQANQIFKVVQIVLGLFGVIALIVSAIGMFNTMTIALLERTQEIGIMKALGATSVDVWNMFLSESVIIGFLGGVGGLGIGMGVGQIFNFGINLLASHYGAQKVALFYTPYWFSVLILSFSTIVGLVTGFYPAKRAAAINCLEALRYK